MKQLTQQDWIKAERRLDKAIEKYSSIANGGFALCWIEPLKRNYDKGERSQELYDMILSIESYEKTNRI